jgi:hypothetical protein
MNIIAYKLSGNDVVLMVFLHFVSHSAMSFSHLQTKRADEHVNEQRARQCLQKKYWDVAI